MGKPAIGAMSLSGTQCSELVIDAALRGCLIILLQAVACKTVPIMFGAAVLDVVSPSQSGPSVEIRRSSKRVIQAPPRGGEAWA